MLKVSLFEFIVRGLPEAFLFIFATYALSKTKIEFKRYIASSLILALVGYLVRFLPIQYGVNTILNLIVLIVLTTVINKLDMIRAIRTGILVIILGYVCEGINIFFIQVVFKIDMNFVFNNTNLKVLYGIPSLAIFALIIFSYYAILKKRKELKNTNHGEIK